MTTHISCTVGSSVYRWTVEPDEGVTSQTEGVCFLWTCETTAPRLCQGR